MARYLRAGIPHIPWEGISEAASPTAALAVSGTGGARKPAAGAARWATFAPARALGDAIAAAEDRGSRRTLALARSRVEGPSPTALVVDAPPVAERLILRAVSTVTVRVAYPSTRALGEALAIAEDLVGRALALARIRVEGPSPTALVVDAPLVVQRAAEHLTLRALTLAGRRVTHPTPAAFGAARALAKDFTRLTFHALARNGVAGHASRSRARRAEALPTALCLTGRALALAGRRVAYPSPTTLLHAGAVDHELPPWALALACLRIARLTCRWTVGSWAVALAVRVQFPTPATRLHTPGAGTSARGAEHCTTRASGYARVINGLLSPRALALALRIARLTRDRARVGRALTLPVNSYLPRGAALRPSGSWLRSRPGYPRRRGNEGATK
jgi:hypothetical protein